MAIWERSGHLKDGFKWLTTYTPYGYPVAWCRRGPGKHRTRWECVFVHNWSPCVGYGVSRDDALDDLVKKHESVYGVVV